MKQPFSMKILIITLFSGENEYKRCLSSVKKQKVDFSFEHFLIENQTKPVAHTNLYSKIMEESDKYDYFVKLDADMVFTRRDSLCQLINICELNGSDKTSITVYDHMTDKMIWGLNVYRSGMKWRLGSEVLFTDQQFIIKDNYKKHAERLNKKSSLVSHASDPTDFQSFIFGVHRASKIIQKNVTIPRMSHAYGQYNTLLDVYRNYVDNSSKQAQLALVGAYYVLSRKTSESVMISKKHYEREFSNLNATDYLEAIKFFKKFGKIKLIKEIGSLRCFLGLLNYMKNKI